MGVNLIGELTIGAILPSTFAGLSAAVNVALPTLQAQLAGALQAQVQIGGLQTVAQLITLAEQMLATLEQLLAEGVPITVTAQVSAVAALVTQLQGQIASLTASLGFLTLAATGGVVAYTYSGPVSQMGAGITSALSGGLPSGAPANAQCNALVLATADSTVWGAMQQVFRTA